MELSNGIDDIIKVSNGPGWLVKGCLEELWVWLEVDAEDVVPEWLEAVVERPEEKA